MATSQKAVSGGKGRSASKSAPKGAVAAKAKSQVKELVETKAAAKATQGNSSEPQFGTIELPIKGTPLARKEIAEKLAEMGPQLGITITANAEGHVVTEEQRQGERRQSENDRRQAERLAEEGAAAVTEIVQGRRSSDNQAAATASAAPETAAPETAAPATVGPVATDPAKVVEFQEAMKELAAKFGMPTNLVNLSGAVVTTPRSGRENKNGIARPGMDTKTGRIWRCADEITAQKKAPASIGELKAHPELRPENDHTIRTQYARWRKFNGIEGRVDNGGTKVAVNGLQENGTVQPMFPPMADSDFMRYQEMVRNNTLPDGYEVWLNQETQRRSKVRAEPTDLSRVAAMDDKSYNDLLVLERNNSPKLTANLAELLQKEKARRGEK